jgi:hypothetical protein
MRTTINISNGLLEKAKKKALQSGRTLTAVIEDALRENLAPHRTAEKGPIRITTYGEGGLLPGVDLDDSARLLDLMEASHDPVGR